MKPNEEKPHSSQSCNTGFKWKSGVLFHKLLKSKYNKSFSLLLYYKILSSQGLPRKVIWLAKNQRCSNPLPRRGGKQAASEQCQTSSCSSLQRSSGGLGTRDTPALPAEWRQGQAGAAERLLQARVWRELEVKWSLSLPGEGWWGGFGMLCSRASESPYEGRNPKRDSRRNKAKIWSSKRV